jgi:regulator of protease activity HflC (stomatin/prohibitin superfamily)
MTGELIMATTETESYPRRPETRGNRHGGRDGPPPGSAWWQQPLPGGKFLLIKVALALLVIYGAYYWLVRRVVVDPDQVLVLMKKDGGRSLPGDQIVIPDPKTYPGGAEAWEKAYGGANGILEAVYLTGSYFFSPFDYERSVEKIAEIHPGKVGVVIRLFGDPLPEGQVLAAPDKLQRGPLPGVLQPGKYPQYSNPHAYQVIEVDPVQVDAGHRGVVTVMAGAPARQPNEYLVGDGEQGVQRQTEPEGFRYVNPFAKRITPISVKSQRLEMSGDDAIRFPSSDGFDIKLEGFVEWSIDPEKLPLIYTQYAEGTELVPHLEMKVILPYSRSFCRLAGSRYTARDFISGDTKLQFQREFAHNLTEACRGQGITVYQALVRDIVPPNAIKDPINEREVARQRVKTLEEQIKVARSQAALARQEALAAQNQQIGEANKQVVTIVARAEQEKNVAVTKAEQELEVAKLRLQAAEKQAEAIVSRGTAEANVVLLKRQAEAEPLRQQVLAFGGDGRAYAQYFFYQQVAPSMKTILTNTDGPFAEIFNQFVPATTRPAPAGTQAGDKVAGDKITGVQP